MAKDILGSERKEHCLKGLTDFLQSVQMIVKCFTKSTLLTAELAEKQHLLKRRALVVQAPTRWSTMRQSCETVLESEDLLLQVVTGRNFLVVQGKACPEIPQVVCDV